MSSLQIPEAERPLYVSYLDFFSGFYKRALGKQWWVYGLTFVLTISYVLVSDLALNRSEARIIAECIVVIPILLVTLPLIFYYLPRKVTKARKLRTITPHTNHVRWCLTGAVVGFTWTLVACGVAFLQGDDVRLFLREWMNLQGPFLITLGTWLLLTIRSGSFTARVSRLTSDGSVNPGVFKNRTLRYILVGSITILGFASGVRMGFSGHGAVLVFMWITLALFDFVGSLVIFHSLEILAVIHNLQQQAIKVSRYAPARTPELRSIVTYFSSFTLLMTIGYAFALLGTLKGDWTWSKDYIQAVRLFWPLINVPLCLIVLIYPHIVVHKLIQREKELTLSTYQRDIDKLLSKYGDLKTEEIERTNTLAQLFDRITATPDYVIDVGIAARIVLPLVFNLVTLFVKVAMIQS